MQKIVSLWLALLNKLGGRLVASLAVAIVAILVTAAFTDGWIVSIREQDSRLQAIMANVQAIERLRTNLFRAESAQRGYLLTHRVEYLAPLKQSIADAKDNIQRINKTLIGQDLPNEMKTANALLLKISASVDSKATEMEMTVGLAKNGKFGDAKQLLNMDKGLNEMHTFLGITKELQELHYKVMYAIVAKRNHNLLMSRLSLILTSITLAILGMIVIRQLLSEISARDRLTRQLALQRDSVETQLAERSGQLSELAFNYQSDVESERRKLALELHDELGSILTASKMDIAWVIRKTREVLPEISEKLAKTNRYLDQAIEFKRRVSDDLHPSMLATLGLWPTIRALVESAAERNQWQLSLSLPEDNLKINDAIGLISYRIVQETLNNAAKYAQASKLDLSIIAEMNMLKIDIIDNGIGMDMSKLEGNTHGLAGMRYRIMAIGGRMDITSAPGHGVSTLVIMPLMAKG
jgi:signal transduction histidine kinase